MKILLIHAEEKAYGKVSHYIESIMDIMGLKTKDEIGVDKVNHESEPKADATVIVGFRPSVLHPDEISKVVSDDYYPNKLLCLVVQERYNSLRFLLELIGYVNSCNLEQHELPHFVKYNELNLFLKNQLRNNPDLLKIISKFGFYLDITNEDRATVILEDNQTYALNSVALNIEAEKDVKKDANKEALNYVSCMGMIDNGTYLLMENYTPQIVRLVRGQYDDGSLLIVAEYAHGKNEGKFCSKITIHAGCSDLETNEAHINTNDLLLNRVQRLDGWLVENGLAEKTGEVFKTGCFEYPLMRFHLDKIPLGERKIIMGRKLLGDGTLAVKILNMSTGEATENVYSEKQYIELVQQLGYVD